MGAMGATGPTSAGGRPILSFTIDTRTNSVIAAGAPDYLALVRQLIEQLDSQEMSSRVNRVYAVKYVDATNLATSLKDYFNAETQRLTEYKQDIPIQQQIDEEVNVTPDKDASKLLISVSPRLESQIMEMVRELDQAPPQVMIQVLMTEVILDNRLEWGFEFAAQDLYFTRTGKDFDTVGGTSLGAARDESRGDGLAAGEERRLLLHRGGATVLGRRLRQAPAHVVGAGRRGFGHGVLRGTRARALGGVASAAAGLGRLPDRVFVCCTCLMSILQRQWITHERLTFPVATVPLEMVTMEGRGASAPGRLTTAVLFWIGLGASFALTFLSTLADKIRPCPRCRSSSTRSSLGSRRGRWPRWGR